MTESIYQGLPGLSNLTAAKFVNLSKTEVGELIMVEDFAHATLGRLGSRVFRLGLSGSYRPGKPAVY